MGHNKDRRPTYPAEKKKNYGKAIFNLLKNGWGWLCFTIVVLCFIYIIVKIPHNYMRRNRIKNNPIETEAVITRIGDATRYIGPSVYYDYYVEDSLYQCIATPGHKIADQLRVGQTIKITYEKDNPSNSMFVRALSEKF